MSDVPPPDAAPPPRRVYRGTRPGGRSARVREAVIAATIAELAEVGYDALSLPHIAERAGVALSTVHRRWDGKVGLVTDAVVEITAAQVPDPHGVDLRADLLQLAASVAQMLREPSTLRILKGMFALPDDQLAQLRSGHWGPRIEVAQAVVDRAIARGELPAGTDGWPVSERIHARIWMRLLITGLPVDDAFLAALVDQSIAAARRGER
ncbi:MAG: TetR/AcrR family transcriptional regulator [Patulibacter minatonensis]